MKKQDLGEKCRNCEYWDPQPARSEASKQVGWCRRPIAYYVNGKDYARGIFLKTSADMHCGDWKPINYGNP